MPLFVATTVHAAANSTRKCEVLLATSPCELAPSDHSPTVQVGTAQLGRHGGRLITLQRTGKQWGSNHTTVGYDVQGDPRWFVEAAGCGTADFFGFKLLSPNLISVPDRREFAGAVEKVNDRLAAAGEEPIGVTFYDSPERGGFKFKDYIDAFVARFALPVASGGNHFVHDISFHSGAIFIPPEAVRAGADRMRYMEGFAEELALHGAPELALELRRLLVELIDVTTSAQNLLLIAREVHPETAVLLSNTSLIFYAGSPRYAPGLSPFQELRRWLEEKGGSGFDGVLSRYSKRMTGFDPFAALNSPEDIGRVIEKRLEQIQGAVRGAGSL